MLVGAFAPATFHPAWLERHNLIRPEEAVQAKLDFVHPEVALLSLGWAKLQVQQDRLALIATDPTQLLPMRDLVVGLIALLEHTPLKQMGFNREGHYKMADEAEWHRVGDQLVPKNLWARRLEGRVGMRSLTVEGNRSGSKAKYVRIRVEPSLQVPHGVFFHLNEHYDFGENSRLSDAASLVAEVWPAVSSFADEVMPQILNDALAAENRQ